MSNDVAVVEHQQYGVVNFEEYAMNVETVTRQVNMIQEIMRAVMKEGEHFGVIPGCQKPSLYKPGAEKLNMTFRLRPEYDVRRTDLPGAHREYEVVCTLFHIPTGQVVGQGVGSATTMEGKYRFRGGEKEGTGQPLPKEYWNLRKAGKTTEAQALIGGPGFSHGKIEGVWEICEIGEKQEHDNPADYYNCVTPDTKVLTHDLQWVRAGDIETGDMLIGVEENMTNEYARHFSIGEATVYGRKVDDLYEVRLEDGRTVRCNGEHQWLVKKVGLKGTEWVSTKDICGEICDRKGRPRNWSIMSVCIPWSEEKSKEAGYIAGLLDADGSLGISQLFVMFAQQQNTVLALLKSGLVDRGYQLGCNPCKPSEAVEQSASQQQVYQVRVLGGFPEQLRLLGSIRPPRLLERWLTLFDLSSRRLEGRGSGAGSPIRIVSVEPVGKGEIVLLGTSCRTYLAEGLVCHNTVLKMAKKRAHVDATLTATAASDIFTQDVEDMPEVIPGAKEAAKKEGKPPLKEPQKKAPETAKTDPPPENKIGLATVSVTSIELREGVTDGKPWKMYGITGDDGNAYKTFSETLADIANTAKQAGQKIQIDYKENKNGRTIRNLQPVEVEGD